MNRQNVCIYLFVRKWKFCKYEYVDVGSKFMLRIRTFDCGIKANVEIIAGNENNSRALYYVSYVVGQWVSLKQAL